MQIIDLFLKLAMPFIQAFLRLFEWLCRETISFIFRGLRCVFDAIKKRSNYEHDKRARQEQINAHRLAQLDLTRMTEIEKQRVKENNRRK